MAGPGRPRKRRGSIDFKGWKYEKILYLSRREKVLDVYPQLKRYPELDPKKYKGMRISFEKVLRYVMYYYTQNALRDAIPEMIHRKKEAAILAGFEIIRDTGKFSGEVERLIKCENELANQLIIRFLRRSENKKFMLLCGFEEARAKQMLKLVDGIGDKEKELTKVVIENVKTLSEDIEDLESELLNQDESPDLMELLYSEVDFTNLGISPEDIAESESEGTTKEILKTPYIHIYDGAKRSHNKV